MSSWCDMSTAICNFLLRKAIQCACLEQPVMHTKIMYPVIVLCSWYDILPNCLFHKAIFTCTLYFAVFETNIEIYSQISTHLVQSHTVKLYHWIMVRKLVVFYTNKIWRQKYSPIVKKRVLNTHDHYPNLLVLAKITC